MYLNGKIQCTKFVIYFCHYTSHITNFDSYGNICRVLDFWARETFAGSSTFGHVSEFLKCNHYFRHVCPSVCQSIRMKELGSLWMDFRKVLYWVGMGVINLFNPYRTNVENRVSS